MGELDAIVKNGGERAIYFVDDDFVGNHKATNELLPHLVEWQKKHGFEEVIREFWYGHNTHQTATSPCLQLSITFDLRHKLAPIASTPMMLCRRQLRREVGSARNPQKSYRTCQREINIPRDRSGVLADNSIDVDKKRTLKFETFYVLYTEHPYAISNSKHLSIVTRFNVDSIHC